MKRIVLATLAFAALAATAHAQNYPTRNITMVVPFPAGGPSDIVARIAAEGMSKHIGQNIIIENVAGAGGTTGSARVAEASPDGYTILAASMGSFVAAPFFYSLKYDSQKDLEPIGMSANAPAAISISPTVPAKDLKEFIAWAKAKGVDAKQAHGGLGGTAHMALSLIHI